MKKMNIKNQKGAISLFVMLSMMFFLIFVVSVYTFVSRRSQTQAMTVDELQSIYKKDALAMSNERAPIDSTEVIPIYNLEQFKLIGTDQYVEVNGKIYMFGKNNTATGKKYSYILKNNIIVNIDEYFNNTLPDFLNSKLYSTSYAIDTSGHDIYYFKSVVNVKGVKQDAYFKLVFFQNLNTNDGIITTEEANNIESTPIKEATKYSVLNELGKEKHKYKNKYEFLLMYENAVESKYFINEFNWWRQNENPFEIVESDLIEKMNAEGINPKSKKVDGYEDVKVNMGYNESGERIYNWGGLAKTSEGDSILDADVFADGHWYSIAMKKRWLNGIPGFRVGPSYQGNKQCYLFARVEMDEIEWKEKGDGTFVNVATGKTKKIGDIIDNAEIKEYIEKSNTGAYVGNWVVLGIENGKLKLISETNVDTKILGVQDPAISGDTDLDKAVNSYKNALSDLDKISKQATGIDYARSVNIEDINFLNGIKNDVDKKNFVDQYGNRYKYYYSNGKICSKFLKSGKEDVDSNWEEKNSSTRVSFRTPNLIINSTNTYIGNPIELALDYYGYNMDETKLSNISAIYTGDYWLASECKWCDTDYTSFAIRYVAGKLVDAFTLFQSYGLAKSLEMGVRAIVYI